MHSNTYSHSDKVKFHSSEDAKRKINGRSFFFYLFIYFYLASPGFLAGMLQQRESITAVP